MAIKKKFICEIDVEFPSEFQFKVALEAFRSFFNTWVEFFSGTNKKNKIKGTFRMEEKYGD